MAVYCTAADLAVKFSIDGTDSFSEQNSAVIEWAIQEATNEIDFFVSKFYESSALATSAWVKTKCVTLALYYLTAVRGLPPRYEGLRDEIREELKLINQGVMNIPFLAKSFDMIPSFSNIEISDYYRKFKARVDSITSTQPGFSSQRLSPNIGPLFYE